MEIVKEKYNNFIAFIKANTPQENEHIQQLNNLSLEHFILIVKSSNAKIEQKDQLLEKLFKILTVPKFNFCSFFPVSFWICIQSQINFCLCFIRFQKQ